MSAEPGIEPRKNVKSKNVDEPELQVYKVVKVYVIESRSGRDISIRTL